MQPISEDSSLKRKREDEDFEPSKKGRLEGRTIISSLNSLRKADFLKQKSQITEIMKNFKSELASGSSSEFSLQDIEQIENNVKQIFQRLEKEDNVELHDLFKEVKVILRLLEKPKARITGSVEGYINSLWTSGDIRVVHNLLTKQTALQFSDDIIELVDDQFLKDVFQFSNKENDLQKVDGFDLPRYRHLTAKSISMLGEMCPHIFESPINVAALQNPQFWDINFKIEEDTIGANLWFICHHSNTINEMLSNFSYDFRELDIADLNISSPILRDCFECIFNPSFADTLEINQFEKIFVAADRLQMPFVLETLDKALANKLHEISVEELKKISAVTRERRVPELKNEIINSEFINFISEMRQRYSPIIDALPATRKQLNSIAEIIFTEVSLLQNLSIPAYHILSKWTSTKTMTLQSYSELISAFSQSFKDLESKNILSEFSLLQSFALENQVGSTSRHEYMQTSYEGELFRGEFLRLLEISCENNPNDVRALTFLGTCHQWSTHPDRYKKALAALERLDDLNEVPQSRCSLAELLYYGTNGIPRDPERAKKLLESELNRGSTEQLIYITLSRILKKEGKPVEAIAILGKGLEKIEPKKETSIKDNENEMEVEMLAVNEEEEEQEITLTLLREYSLYEKILNGEEITPAERNKVAESVLHQKTNYVSNALPFFILQNFENLNRESQRMFSDLRAQQFSYEYSFFKDVLKHYPEEVKMKLFYDTRVQNLLSQDV